MRLEELNNLTEDLRDADTNDDEAFHELLARAIDLLQLLDKDIANDFGVSRPTVTRWRNGSNAPHPAMRKPVFDLLEKRANALLKRMKRNATARSSSGVTTRAEIAARGR